MAQRAKYKRDRKPLIFIVCEGRIVMGVFFAIAQKNEDKEKARKMIKNYVIGLVLIFAILVACPYLVIQSLPKLSNRCSRFHQRGL